MGGATACRNPLCERRVTVALYCCAPCAMAHDGGYEIHETGPLAHSEGCNKRHVDDPTSRGQSDG